MQITMSQEAQSEANGEVDAVQFTAAVIGRQLKAMREGASLSQGDIAKSARTRPEVISRLENGRGNPTVKLVERVIRAIKGMSP